MRKILTAIISFFILICIMVLLVLIFKTETNIKDEDMLQIVATLFPQYDFAKNIVGDKGNIKLLLNSGIETHNYEPTAKDMINILNDSDMFLYIGTDLEPWTTNIIHNLEETDCKVVNLSDNIDLIKMEEFEERNIINSHNNEHDNHDEIYDEHIWLNPLNAVKMIDGILEAICELDPENSDYYIENAEKYKFEILNLDNQIRNVVNQAGKKEIAVGGEFAYAYLVDEYNLNFISVYNNCGEGEDINISKVKSVIDYINKNEIPVVFYEELSEGTVAKMIAEETEAEPLILYSIHNGDIYNDSYISLMRKNLESLKKALN